MDFCNLEPLEPRVLLSASGLELPDKPVDLTGADGPATVVAVEATGAELAGGAMLAAPANDNFADAAILEGENAHASGTNVDSTHEEGEPNHHPGEVENTGSVWWRWTAPANARVRLDTIGSDYDTVVGVYTGDAVDDLEPIVRNDDFNATWYDGDNPWVSYLSFDAVAGRTYHIAVDGYPWEDADDDDTHAQPFGQIQLNLKTGDPGDERRKFTFAGDVVGDGTDEAITFNLNTGIWRIASKVGDDLIGLDWANWTGEPGWQNPIVGDFNGDGLTDVAAQNDDNAWWVGLSTGAEFRSSAWGWWNPANEFESVQTGDFNGDGRTDLLGQAANGTRWVSRSTGSGFETSGWGHWPVEIAWENVMIGDFNGDGRDDLAGKFVNIGGTDVWWVAESTGNRLNNRFYSGWQGDATDWLGAQFVSADFDGDGTDDIAGRDPETGIWWLGISERHSDRQRFVPQGWGNWGTGRAWAMTLTGDFNGDGRDDLVGQIDEDDTNAWWISRSRQRFNSPWPHIDGRFQTEFYSGWVNGSHDIVVGDFDGDGRDDVLGMDGYNSWWWVRGISGNGHSGPQRL
ncbi:MAG: FG-GAP-like repeat-containing protein [Phycisphaeraceae bacterium]